ncbi:hypothetical protein E2C01_054259 [Portunus trituberculatus]|uniref:Uncharacterized protein n=1 Tax=Portunus trituberculatus TaxID=210409 RepID=A0A5B7GIU7_PORTR|nr:hypothetical protein [Portunus trituberculatus]
MFSRHDSSRQEHNTRYRRKGGELPSRSTTKHPPLTAARPILNRLSQQKLQQPSGSHHFRVRERRRITLGLPSPHRQARVLVVVAVSSPGRRGGARGLPRTCHRFMFTDVRQRPRQGCKREERLLRQINHLRQGNAGTKITFDGINSADTRTHRCQSGLFISYASGRMTATKRHY